MADRAPAPRAAALAALLAAGCAFTDPGEGSRGLVVVASFQYSAPAAGAAATDTVADVTLRRQGATATGTATVTDVATGEAITLTSVPGTGHFTGALAGYRRQLQLRVAADQDSLRCRIEAPGLHTVAAPDAVAVSQHGAEVVWRTQDGLRADEVDIKLASGALSRTLDDDVGTYALPDEVNDAPADVLIVTRRNHVLPAGGAYGSLVSAEVTVQAQFPGT